MAEANGVRSLRVPGLAPGPPTRAPVSGTHVCGHCWAAVGQVPAQGALAVRRVVVAAALKAAWNAGLLCHTRGRLPRTSCPVGGPGDLWGYCVQLRTSVPGGLGPRLAAPKDLLLRKDKGAGRLLVGLLSQAALAVWES